MHTEKGGGKVLCICTYVQAYRVLFAEEIIVGGGGGWQSLPIGSAHDHSADRQDLRGCCGDPVLWIKGVLW